MIVDGSSRDYPAVEEPEDGICRLRKELLDSGARGIKLENGGGQLKSKSFRRKRLELRRLSSLAAEKSAVGGGCVSSDHDGGRSRKRRSILELGKNSTGSGRIDGSCHGTASHIGRRREMEDVVTAEPGFLRRCGRDYDFYGVYDGHGGRRVADSCAEMMHVMLARALEHNEDVAWHMAMAAVFRDMDEEVNRYGTEVATMGSTAVVAVVGEEELVVANCGDSRAVLSRGGAAVQLLEDHKPDRADELERIEACGGKVINWNGARVVGVLATSRSIGDSYLKPYVIPDPEVRVISRTISDEFLILASDGLWDVITNKLACQVVRRCLAGRLRGATLLSSNDGDADGKSEEKMGGNRFEEAAAALAELAIGKGSGDNVSVVVVGLS